MTRRVYIGNSGGQFLFRASQPGVDAVTGDISRMATFDLQQPMVPKAQGVVGVGASSNGKTPASVTVSTGVAFAYPPFVLIKCTDGFVCGENSVWAMFNAAGNQITIYNLATAAKTVKWWAFAEL